MKKPLIILTSLILLCIMIVGCQTTNATINTSSELNKNLNLLSNTVSRLDTIDNEYLINNEIYTLNNTTPTQKISRKNILSNNNKDIKVEKINLSDSIRDALSNELINRIYCDENGNCKICNEKFTCDNNNMCNSCNQTIICDSNGNCTSCGDPLIIDNNNCNNCKTSCISTQPNTNIDNKTKELLNQISSNNKNLNIEFLSSNNNISNTNEMDSDNNINIDDNSSMIVDTDIDNENTPNNNTNTSNTDYSFIFYSENSIIPDLRYRPRFISDINYDTVNSNINNYIEKLKKLYTMTADVVEANNTLADYKILILDNINETKELNNCIINGSCNPNSQQVIALNNYIEDIKNTVSNLRRCNGNLTNEINKIASTNTGLTQSLDITNSNYLRILNQIDTRISYHENAVATLEQIKYLLQDAQNNNPSQNIEIEDLLTNQNNTSDNNTNLNNEDEFENTNTNNNSFDAGLENEITEDNQSNDIDSDISTNTDTVENNNSSNNTESNNNNINDNIEENINADTIITPDTTIEKENNLVETEDTFVNIDNSEKNDNDTEKNLIDEEFSFSNIDTYQENPKNLDLDTQDNNENNNHIDNSEIISSNEQDTVANNPTPQMVDGSINNNYNNNTMYDNSIITQNNLNNNNIGNNSYRYDEDGDLYNNTNGYNNANINNINERNNNVNTYKYNTLIDSLNRGTVNNGINNL